MKNMFGILLILLSCQVVADKERVFVGYELLEMSMNEFNNFAGEVGYRFEDGNRIRLTIMDVMLTERHLSSSIEAGAIEGEDVKGVFRGYEINYDRAFGATNWYYSFNTGYYIDKYQHVDLREENVKNNTITIGTGVGYLKRDLFEIKHLYVNLSLPVRYYFDDIEKEKLGDTIVNEHKIVNNIWLFIGYNF